MQVKVNRPVTIYIRFTAEMPTRFELYGEKLGLYYFRNLPKGTPRIKMNIVDPDTYMANVPFEITKTVAVETPAQYPELPPAERDRYKQVSFVYDPTLVGTPAAIYTETGVIVHSAEYYTLPRPIRLFIDLHEQGHLFYYTEEYCDLWALISYLRMGYNRSMAYYTLREILGVSQGNIHRMNTLLKKIQITADASNEFKA